MSYCLIYLELERQSRVPGVGHSQIPAPVTGVSLCVIPPSQLTARRSHRQQQTNAELGAELALQQSVRVRLVFVSRHSHLNEVWAECTVQCSQYSDVMSLVLLNVPCVLFVRLVSCFMFQSSRDRAQCLIRVTQSVALRMSHFVTKVNLIAVTRIHQNKCQPLKTI